MPTNNWLLFNDRSDEVMTREEQHTKLAMCRQCLATAPCGAVDQRTIGQRCSFEAHLETVLFLVLAGPRSPILGSTVLCPDRRAAGRRAAATRCMYELGQPKGKKMGALLTISTEYSDHLAIFITTFLPEGWTGPCDCRRTVVRGCSPRI